MFAADGTCCFVKSAEGLAWLLTFALHVDAIFEFLQILDHFLGSNRILTITALLRIQVKNRLSLLQHLLVNCLIFLWHQELEIRY